MTRPRVLGVLDAGLVEAYAFNVAMEMFDTHKVDSAAARYVRLVAADGRRRMGDLRPRTGMIRRNRDSVEEVATIEAALAAYESVRDDRGEVIEGLQNKIAIQAKARGLGTKRVQLEGGNFNLGEFARQVSAHALGCLDHELGRRFLQGSSRWTLYNPLPSAQLINDFGELVEDEAPKKLFELAELLQQDVVNDLAGRRGDIPTLALPQQLFVTLHLVRGLVLDPDASLRFAGYLPRLQQVVVDPHATGIPPRALEFPDII